MKKEFLLRDLVIKKALIEKQKFADTSKSGKRAKDSVNDMKKVQISLLTLTVVGILLIVVNLTSNPNYLWAAFPITFWGLGIAIQGFKSDYTVT